MNCGFTIGSAQFVGNLSPVDDNAGQTIQVDAAVPVRLVSFDASISNCNTNLVWKSATETNFAKYILQYSKDGINYSDIETVLPKGDNSIYNAVHASPAPGKAFYRLKMVDLDGRFEYSKLVVLNVNCKGKAETFIYPNPATDILNVNISIGAAEKAPAVLYDAIGQKVLSQTLINGTNQLKVANLTPGTYYLSIDAEGGPERHKIIINHK